MKSKLGATLKDHNYSSNELMPAVEHVWDPKTTGHGYFKGTTACLSALYSAGRHQELLSLLEKARFKWWHDRRWGVKAPVAMSRNADAIRYAEESQGLNAQVQDIARTCEEILLISGFADEAYVRYAIAANHNTTNLATFRAIAKKYSSKTAETILRDLVASQPGQEGKWFAAAKDASLFDVAIELANQSPTDPRTLIRAARDYAVEQPAFAVAAGMAALRHIGRGNGYDITDADVLDAYAALMRASASAGIQEATVKADIRAVLSANTAGDEFIRNVLARYLVARCVLLPSRRRRYKRLPMRSSSCAMR
jgi:hypothetical protein